MKSDSFSEDEGSEGIIKNTENLSTNKPYESLFNEKQQQIEELKSDNEKHLAQNIPVLNLKSKQIPHFDHLASYSPSQWETLMIENTKNSSSIETPVNRSK